MRVFLVVSALACLTVLLLAGCGGRAGLQRIRFHDLRHSAATLLLSLGANPKVVQEVLGHSQIGVTIDVYAHVLPTMQREAMADLNRLLTA